MARLLLVLPSATYRASDFIDAARRLGAEVVVASDHRQTWQQVSGSRSVQLDLDDPDAAAAAIVDFAQQVPLEAIVAVDDQGVIPATAAAAKLGLAHNRLEAAAATRDKAAQRIALSAAGLHQPRFRLAGPDDDVAALATEVGLPCVVKPLSLSASRGVIRADSPTEAAAAAERVRRILADAGADAEGPVLVEQFIAGDELAVEALLRGGELEILAIFDKPDPLVGPYFEETLYVTPSRHDAALLETVRETVAEAVAAIGLTEGPVHAELRLRDGRAWPLEVAARSIGGLCSRALRFGVGTSLEEVILRHALGLPLHALAREGAAAGVMMLPIPHAGVLRSVGGLEAARAVPGVAGVEITVAAGRPVVPLPEGDRYLGFVFARARTPGEVEDALRTAHGALDIVIEPQS